MALGGAAGTLLRALVAWGFPPSATGFPWAILLVNLAGCALVGHGYVLNGSEALTARDLVKILSDVLSHTSDFVNITSEQAAKEVIDGRTPAQLAEVTRDLNELLRTRRVGQIAEDIENLTGIAPATFRDWCERHADEFR